MAILNRTPLKELNQYIAIVQCDCEVTDMITIENEIVAWASSGIEGSRGSTENSRGTLN